MRGLRIGEDLQTKTDGKMKKIMFNDRYGLTKAVLEGKKTQTRRVISDKILDKIKLFQDEYLNASCDLLEGKELIEAYMVNYPEKLPYNVGEIVAVAQCYRDICDECFWHGAYTVRTSKLYRLAGWSNKMFTSSDEMPHQIRITDVRVEHLQDISDEDCLKEGVQYIDDIDLYYCKLNNCKEKVYFRSLREAYAALIDKVSGKGTWESNPYVFVYDLELIK